MFRTMIVHIVASLTSVTLGVAGPTSPAEGDRPNVVFILADDLGWTDLGSYGSGYYRTPNIDRLAAEGIRLTDAYTCGPNCQPTRAALMSGQYGPRTGIYTVGSRDRFDWRSRNLEPPENVTELSPEVVTVAEASQRRRIRHRDVRQMASGLWPRTLPNGPGVRRGDRRLRPTLRFQDDSPGRDPRGDLPGRLPDRSCRRLHRPSQR